MFSSIGWGEIAVLVVVALVVLGPERLPGAVTWTMKSIRQVRDYATGATGQLKEDLGSDFDDLRKPLSQLNELRGMTPRSIVTKHLLDGDDSVFRMAEGVGDDLKSLDPTKLTQTPEIKPVSAPMPTPEVPSSPASEVGRSTREPGNRRPAVGDWDAT
ncbi:Sec-independent protein translocase protein TatB [Gordonia sp. ABSL1-1]|uniref:Sec-independent protein translocase protein TatB n=1 Tax=Gordonia sp. ABSL1-1 TaxID=3053923 RepID=UPI002572DC78|nr:Sec-independent protein translocase protein TatB [Gordonia sp. ABSL1-1]MDL9937074.1 Sec-independent protein translocase protein TatB [Gordonia sp. ABSL1-1]